MFFTPLFLPFDGVEKRRGTMNCGVELARTLDYHVSTRPYPPVMDIMFCYFKAGFLLFYD
jgi:hypothetical protein